MRLAVVGLMVLAVAVPALATPSLQISLGVRETGLTLPIGSFNMAGNPGGTPGGIEQFRKDVQGLPLDGNWYQFSFSISAADIDPLGGLTGNGVIGANSGTIDHIRIKSNGYQWPITTWVDEMRVVFDTGPLPPAPTDLLISSFNDDGTGNPFADGTEVMFQEPGFSGSTNMHYNTAGPNVSGIDNTDGHDDTHSVKAQWQFKDSDPSRWIRYTPYLTTTKPNPQANPQIAEVMEGGTYNVATVTFWMKGVPEPASMTLLALGGLLALRRRS